MLILISIIFVLAFEALLGIEIPFSRYYLFHTILSIATGMLMLRLIENWKKK